MAPWLVGCGAGSPLLHPAHTLPAGDVTFGAGVSSAFVLGEADAAIDEAQQLGVEGAGSAQDPAPGYVEGIIASVATAPGLAPWVGARAGVGTDSDAGVAYTGRTVRVDGRHAFEEASTALSVGLGITGLLLQDTAASPDRGAAIPGVDADGVTGFGADVPVIGGWRSDAELVSIWGGARGGVERLWGGLKLFDMNPDDRAELDATRWYAGGLFGLSVGVEPVRVAIELDVSWSHVSGTLDRDAPGVSSRSKAAVEAWTVVPAGAVVGRF